MHSNILNSLISKMFLRLGFKSIQDISDNGSIKYRGFKALSLIDIDHIIVNIKIISIFSPISNNLILKNDVDGVAFSRRASVINFKYHKSKIFFSVKFESHGDLAQKFDEFGMKFSVKKGLWYGSTPDIELNENLDLVELFPALSQIPLMRDVVINEADNFSIKFKGGC